jgi:stage IV sporulation protein A
MNSFSIYEDIEGRTNGEIYMAVVGPVRTGKSTFIRRFSELLILPNVSDEAAAEVIDQLPLSGSGTTITTVEPKFIPREAVTVNVSDEDNPRLLKLRLIDCVGYMVNGANGHLENGNVRMVKTPWNDNEIPFTDAADIGTGRVIYEHSTVAIAVTTDGSISELTRESYLEAEERTVSQLKETKKPFVMVLNTIRPMSAETKRLSEELSIKYDIPVIPINLEQLRMEDILKIFEELISMFPVASVSFELPDFFFMLDEEDDVKKHVLSNIRDICSKINCMKDISDSYDEYCSTIIENINLLNCHLESGNARIRIDINRNAYYAFISGVLGKKVEGEIEFLEEIKALSKRSSEYDRLKEAWADTLLNGYGVVLPEKSEITMHEPEIIRQGNKYGIKIHVTAPCTHFIRTEIETELAPVVGSEAQARDLYEFITSDDGRKGIWNTDIFGKSMGMMVEDEIETKINSFGYESREKLRDSMNKIVNESCGLICFAI